MGKEYTATIEVTFDASDRLDALDKAKDFARHIADKYSEANVLKVHENEEVQIET